MDNKVSKPLINHFHFRLIRLLIARITLLAICAWASSFIVCSDKKYRVKFLTYIIPVSLIIVETVYIISKRKGHEFKWFSFSAFAYTIVVMSIVLIELNYGFNISQTKTECKNETFSKAAYQLFFVCYRYELPSCLLFDVIGTLFFIPLVFLRWLTPSGKSFSGNSHSALVFHLITSAADILDFIEYTKIPEVKNDSFMVNVIIIIASVSLLQYSFSLTATKKTTEKDHGCMFWIDFIFGTEVWSLILILLIEDIPFLIVRTSLMSKNGIFMTPTITFYFEKNLFRILAGLYRIKTLYDEFNQSLEELKSIKTEDNVILERIEKIKDMNDHKF